MSPETGSRPLSRSRKAIFYAVLVLLMGLVFEVLSFLLYRVNPFWIFKWQYYDSALAEVKLPAVPYGWDADYGVRPRPGTAVVGSACAAAFGDSFTRGDEVGDDATWANVASGLLGCGIENYGVGGFGTDQAYLRFLDLNPRPPVVLLGVYQEMLRRNLAASWVFYAAQKQATLKPYFMVRDGALMQVPMPRETSAESVRTYHAADRYYRLYRVRYPYSLNLVRAVYYRIRKKSFKRLMLIPSESAYADAEAVELQAALLQGFRQQALKRGQQFVPVFLPTPRQAAEASYPYREFLNRYRAQHPEDCVIDPGPALTRASQGDREGLSAPLGHFNVSGNLAIAQEVSTRLRDCGLVTQARAPVPRWSRAATRSSR